MYTNNRQSSKALKYNRQQLEKINRQQTHWEPLLT